KRADRLGAACVLIVGENELKEGRAILRDMETKVQEEVALEGLVEELTKRFAK
ncbi:MAG: His/Gly/Thr/Pro-type tRNA ligase C-terminal domain-containing protein, partial [Desulfobacterales bacterium]